jgi:hypothetical protein
MISTWIYTISLSLAGSENMKEIIRIEEVLIEDRGFEKVRLNIVRNNRIFGFIKPI